MTDANQERIARLEDLVERRLAAISVDSGNWTAPQIKEFVESILTEKDRALEMATDEREKAASALRGEQQRALDQANQEREKAAQNLRVELARAIAEGDDRLREHIQNQIVQIREALASADKLEIERVDAANVKTDGVRREVQLVQGFSEQAISKAEVSTEKRFESVNEFRAQLADTIATFVPREVFDTEGRRISAVEAFQSKILGALALFGILVPILTALAVYLLTRHGITVLPTK